MIPVPIIVNLRSDLKTCKNSINAVITVYMAQMRVHYGIGVIDRGIVKIKEGLTIYLFCMLISIIIRMLSIKS